MFAQCQSVSYNTCVQILTFRVLCVDVHIITDNVGRLMVCCCVIQSVFFTVDTASVVTMPYRLFRMMLVSNSYCGMVVVL